MDFLSNKNSVKNKISGFFSLVFWILIFPYPAHATIYQPGETLEPDCAPNSSNCGVTVTISTLGTDSPIGNSQLSIQATSTDSVLATLRAFVGQVANLFQIQDSSGVNLFSVNASGNLILNNLNGPLQANAGLVSATTSIGVLYGGTGLVSAPSYGQMLVGNGNGGYTLTATSSLGLNLELGGFSTTSTSFYLTQFNQFSTTSAQYFVSNPTIQFNGFSTTSANYFIQNAPVSAIGFSTSSAAFYLSQNNQFSSTSAAAYLANNNQFSTTSAAYFALNPTVSFFSTTSANYWNQNNESQFNGFSTTSANWHAGRITSPVGASSTLAVGNLSTFYGGFVSNASSSIGSSLSVQGALTLGNLNGPLQANAGLVSATTSISVLYGGTGLSSLVSNQLLIGGAGNTVTQIATSSLGLQTTHIAEGSNLYFTPDRVAGVLAATTTTALPEGSNLYFTNSRVASVIAATTTDALMQGLLNKYYADFLVQSFVHGSSTIPKTYSDNVFTADNTFSGGLSLGNLNGPLQANAGLVSATSSVGVTYGGTGLAAAPTYGNILVGNSNGSYTLTATSSLGLGGSSGTVSSVDASGGTTGFSFTGGPITTSGTLTLSGVLNTANGGTGLSGSPIYGQILVGNSSGGYTLTATSSLGLGGGGGFDQTAFSQGWIYSSGGGSSLAASTSPTVNYITATSTSNTSTFAKLLVSNLFTSLGTASTTNLIASNEFSGAGLSDCHATSSKLTWNANTKQFGCGIDHGTPLMESNSLSSTFTLTSTNSLIISTAISPSLSTNNIWVTASAQINSGNTTDDTATVTIVRGYVCGTNVLATRTKRITLTPTTGVGEGHVSFTFTDSPATTASTTYSMCASDTGIVHTITERQITVQEVDTVGAADLAEIYPTNDTTIESGDVVSLDPSMDLGVKKSDRTQNTYTIGVVSTKPALLIGGTDNIGISGVPVALSGRVPVKVVTENGVLVPGDYLTPSSIPGVAMKANDFDPVFGQVMAEYDKEGVGMILAFVKNFDTGLNLPRTNNTEISSTTLIGAVQSENALQPLAVIAEKIDNSIDFFANFVSARITAIRGYFDEIFTAKIHTEQLCVKKSRGGEVCLNGDEIVSILNNANISPVLQSAPNNDIITADTVEPVLPNFPSISEITSTSGTSTAPCANENSASICSGIDPTIQSISPTESTTTVPVESATTVSTGTTTMVPTESATPADPDVLADTLEAPAASASATSTNPSAYQ